MCWTWRWSLWRLERDLRIVRGRAVGKLRRVRDPGARSRQARDAWALLTRAFSMNIRLDRCSRETGEEREERVEEIER